MKVIVINNTDGTCGIMVPATKALEILTIEDIAAKDVPEGLSWRICDNSNLPSSREFRNAWTDSNATDTVDIDIDKAKSIHLDNIRKVRDKKLALLDVETLKGIDVQAEKQVLRDIPQVINLTNINNIEDLKLVWPEELK